MTILYLFRSLAIWGGIERMLVEKMNHLVKEYDMDVYMLTTDQGNHSIPYYLEDGVKIEDLGVCFHHKYRYGLFRRFWVEHQKNVLYERLLHSRIQKIKPDVIVCTTSDPIQIITKVKGTIPLVIESHSICIRTIEHGKVRLLRKIYRSKYLKTISKAEVLVALTEGDAIEWRNYHHNVVVIPNFIHRNNSSPAALVSKHVIFVGRFDYQKRVQDALRIWESVHQRFPDWILDIYGDGELKSDVLKRVSCLENVIVHAPTDSIYDCYRESSILMMTSLFEPFGLVLPEAMSCGLPVVAFECPYGPVDIIADGQDGFLIKDRNIDEFVEKVCLLIETPQLRKKMGQVGIHTSKRFSSDLIMPRWVQLFNKCNVK